MSSIRPHPNQHSSLDGELSPSVLDDNLELPGTSQGGLSLEATSAYEQAEIEALWLSLVQMVPQLGIPPHETQAHGAATEGQRIRMVGGKARPVCAYCNKDFVRTQELARHVTDKHTQRRRCPFCNFMWTRPGKIKPHLVANHAEKFPAEMLEAIKRLSGRGVVEFVNGYDHGLGTPQN